VFWAAPICHPLPLAAVLGLALNDHLLKGADLLPMAVTGKLSDVLGLFFFPALLLALWRLVYCPPRPSLAGPILVIVLTAVGFMAANLHVGFNAWLGSWFGSKLMDSTDLVALPALIPAWLWIRRCDEKTLL